MSKKNTGGKNFKKMKTPNSKIKRELVFKDDEQSYGRIIKMLGDGRFECSCFELDKNLIGHIRGSMRRRVWLTIGDIVLVSLRDFDDKKCDIIHKYSLDEAQSLKKFGEIPQEINLMATSLEIKDNDDQFVIDQGFEFQEI